MIKGERNLILFTLLLVSGVYFRTHHLGFGSKYLELIAGVVKRNGLWLPCVPKARPLDQSTPQKTSDNALGCSRNHCA